MRSSTQERVPFVCMRRDGKRCDVKYAPSFFPAACGRAAVCARACQWGCQAGGMPARHRRVGRLPPPCCSVPPPRQQQPQRGHATTARGWAHLGGRHDFWQCIANGPQLHPRLLPLSHQLEDAPHHGRGLVLLPLLPFLAPLGPAAALPPGQPFLRLLLLLPLHLVAPPVLLTGRGASRSLRQGRLGGRLGGHLGGRLCSSRAWRLVLLLLRRRLVLPAGLPASLPGPAPRVVLQLDEARDVSKHPPLLRAAQRGRAHDKRRPLGHCLVR
jgi:hypothetical protein